jgi:hypothetical protein
MDMAEDKPADIPRIPRGPANESQAILIITSQLKKQSQEYLQWLSINR